MLCYIILILYGIRVDKRGYTRCIHVLLDADESFSRTRLPCYTLALFFIANWLSTCQNCTQSTFLRRHVRILLMWEQPGERALAMRKKHKHKWYMYVPTDMEYKPLVQTCKGVFFSSSLGLSWLYRETINYTRKDGTKKKNTKWHAPNVVIYLSCTRASPSASTNCTRPLECGYILQYEFGNYAYRSIVERKVDGVWNSVHGTIPRLDRNERNHAKIEWIIGKWM
jgi:hypothetical protein